MTLADALITHGQNAASGFVLAFFVAAFVAVDVCFWPRTRGSLERSAARSAARRAARRAEYRARLEEASR